MPETIRAVMSANPVTLSRNSSVVEAARAMREKDIGDVVVIDNGDLFGIATDRDLVVRGIAEGKDPQKTSLAEVCSPEPMTLSPDDKITEAVELMRNKAIRRVPVVENGKPVGIVSLGDLAIEKDRQSVLADISAAKPNN